MAVLRIAIDRDCPACEVLEPELRAAGRRLRGRVRIERIQARMLPPGGAWRPRYVPSLRLETGGRLMGQLSGYVGRDELERWVLRRVGDGHV